MRARIALGAVSLLGLLVVGGSRPAEAVGAGTMTVNCTATFPRTPHSLPGLLAGGSCTGSVVAAAGGVDDALVPYTLAGLGTFGAGFQYREPCPVAGAPAVVTYAKGAFAAGPFIAVHGTNITSASVTGQFVWLRVGVNEVIKLSGVIVTFSDGGSATVPGVGAGAATYAPPTNFNPMTELLCGTGGGPMNINVVAEAVFSA